jgi:hypothetical protein
LCSIALDTQLFQKVLLYVQIIVAWKRNFWYLALEQKALYGKTKYIFYFYFILIWKKTFLSILIGSFQCMQISLKLFIIIGLTAGKS